MRVTESIYARIDEVRNMGEIQSIPYSENMVLESGKYYTQNGVTYVSCATRETPYFSRLPSLRRFMFR